MKTPKPTVCFTVHLPRRIKTAFVQRAKASGRKVQFEVPAAFEAWAEFSEVQRQEYYAKTLRRWGPKRNLP